MPARFQVHRVPIRNALTAVSKRLIAFSRRQYVAAAPDVDIYGAAMIVSVWAGLLLATAIGELLPGDSTPIKLLSQSRLNDKVLHFSAYAALAFVPIFGLRISSAVICVLTAEVAGIGLDIAQSFIRERSCDPYDILANTVGIVAGIVIALLIRSRLVQSHYNPAHKS
jgi:VanZ family protein